MRSSERAEDRPRSALAAPIPRFQDHHSRAGPRKRPGDGEAGGSGADDDDVESSLRPPRHGRILLQGFGRETPATAIVDPAPDAGVSSRCSDFEFSLTETGTRPTSAAPRPGDRLGSRLRRFLMTWLCW
jgi:hypothetical protein